jgi:hypothetical protein
MKTITERKNLKRESRFQSKRNLKESRSMQEKSRHRGEFQRERLGFVLESGV